VSTPARQPEGEVRDAASSPIVGITRECVALSPGGRCSARTCSWYRRSVEDDLVETAPPCTPRLPSASAGPPACCSQSDWNRLRSLATVAMPAATRTPRLAKELLRLDNRFLVGMTPSRKFRDRLCRLRLRLDHVPRALEPRQIAHLANLIGPHVHRDSGVVVMARRLRGTNAKPRRRIVVSLLRRDRFMRKLESIYCRSG